MSVSTLAVEWIEIMYVVTIQCAYFVSTLAVEWIEIINWTRLKRKPLVSTLAVEWIEIGQMYPADLMESSLHPRGGVD